MEYNYPLDYHWSTEEIIDVIALYNAVEKFSKNLKLKKQEVNVYKNKASIKEFTFGAIANVAELIMSEKGAFITGSDFLIDSGATASYYYGKLKPDR